MEIKIDFLKYHQDKIPDIAKAIFKEWSHLIPGKTLFDVEDTVRKRINIEKIPLALIALNDHNEWIGTVSLKETDLDTRQDLSPWLASLFVKKEYRNKNIGEKLVFEIIKKAQNLQYEIIYLYTDNAEEFYVKLGWNLLERQNYLGNNISVMEYKI